MKDLVFVGATVAETVAAAADTLGQAPEALRYVVLESGTPARGRTPAEPARIVVLSDPGPAGVVEAVLVRDRVVPAPPGPRARRSVADRLAAVAEELTRSLGTTMTLSFEDGADERTITMTAADPRPGFWGQTGEVYRALEHLLKRIGVDDGERSPRVVSLEYRAWRDAQLHEQALSLAAAVAADQKARAFPRLNAYERRVVHVALAGRSDVGTRSVGEGEDRELFIEPRAVGE